MCCKLGRTGARLAVKRISDRWKQPCQRVRLHQEPQPCRQPCCQDGRAWSCSSCLHHIGNFLGPRPGPTIAAPPSPFHGPAIATERQRGNEAVEAHDSTPEWTWAVGGPVVHDHHKKGTSSAERGLTFLLSLQTLSSSTHHIHSFEDTPSGFILSLVAVLTAVDSFIPPAGYSSSHRTTVHRFVQVPSV